MGCVGQVLLALTKRGPNPVVGNGRPGRLGLFLGAYVNPLFLFLWLRITFGA